MTPKINKLGQYIDGLKNCTLELQYKVFMWWVWANFLNKINEKLILFQKRASRTAKFKIYHLVALGLMVVPTAHLPASKWLFLIEATIAP